MAPETVLRDARDFIAQGDLPSALALLQAARLRCADHAGIALLLADVLQGSGRIREAVAAYTAGLALNDMSADGWYGAGCAHLALSAPASAADLKSRSTAGRWCQMDGPSVTRAA